MLLIPKKVPSKLYHYFKTLRTEDLPSVCILQWSSSSCKKGKRFSVTFVVTVSTVYYAPCFLPTLSSISCTWLIDLCKVGFWFASSSLFQIWKCSFALRISISSNFCNLCQVQVNRRPLRFVSRQLDEQV